jgi:hypothetical protein
MHFELWDTASRNMLDDFATEAEALAAVAELLVINEPDMVDDLSLLRVGGPDNGATVASGVELARLATATTPPPGRLQQSDPRAAAPPT